MLKGRGLRPGARVGPYEVLEPLGRGGMARVYRARSETQDDVALKVLEPEFTGQARSARFEREVQAAARLAHSGCARLLDHGATTDGHLYLAIERLAGPTLREELAARGRLPPREAIEIGLDLCRALAHAHAAGVLHRDIKPENVMYRGPGAAGGVVLIDFGLSRLRDDAPLTVAGTCLGSPSYVAPERLLERPADGRSDLYAVGVVLYEVLAGRPPFVGDGPLAIARQHIATRPRPLAELCPEAPPALAAIVHRALAKQPEDRFDRAESMTRALEAVAAEMEPGLDPDAGADLEAEATLPNMRPDPGTGSSDSIP